MHMQYSTFFRHSVPDLFLSIIPDRTDDFAPAEFAIGTRYGVMPAGSASIDKDWPLYRRVISSGARLLARPLTPLSDPMTGFFAMTSRCVICVCATVRKYSHDCASSL